MKVLPFQINESLYPGFLIAYSSASKLRNWQFKGNLILKEQIHGEWNVSKCQSKEYFILENLAVLANTLTNNGPMHCYLKKGTYDPFLWLGFTCFKTVEPLRGDRLLLRNYSQLLRKAAFAVGEHALQGENIHVVMY